MLAEIQSGHGPVASQVSPWTLNHQTFYEDECNSPWATDSAPGRAVTEF